MANTTTVEQYVATLPEPLRETGATVRALVDGVMPESGVVWHRHPVWKVDGTPVCLIKAYKSYVTFGFWQGREITDSSGRMETAKGLAHVKLASAADVDATLFTDWLRQARDLALEGSHA